MPTNKDCQEQAGLVKVEKRYLAGRSDFMPILSFWEEHHPEKLAKFHQICDFVRADKGLKLAPIELFDIVMKYMLQCDFWEWKATTGKNVMALDEQELKIMESLRKMSADAGKVISASRRGDDTGGGMPDIADAMEYDEITMTTTTTLKKKSRAEEYDLEADYEVVKDE